MYLADYHTHSKLSPDGAVPLSAMADAALAAGLHELCITDHYDLVDGYGHPAPPQDWGPSLAQMAETLPQFAGRLTLKLGVEFGSAHLDPALSRTMLALPQLDFVIGSVHNWSPQGGGGDFYFTDYNNRASCALALEDYLTSMEALVPLADCYDVLGHIIYPLRYMLRDGQHFSLAPYLDRIDGILKTTVSLGRGIEVNTWRGQSVAEWKPVLERFRAHGGDRVTIGSDAHTPEGVGAGIRESQSLLRSLGFRYFCTYQRHVPTFIPL